MNLFGEIAAAMPDAPASQAARFVAAPPEAVWAALMDPKALAEWLPPGDMTGTVHAFDGRTGGGYEMSLFYRPGADHTPGKTAAHEDRVAVRFTAVEPPRRIVEAVRFASDDPALGGEMTIEITLSPAPGGTEVRFDFRDLPPGLRPEDNAEGARQSLAQLAARFADCP